MSTPARRATFEALAKKQRQMVADALANEAVDAARPLLANATPEHAARVLELYATPYQRLLEQGANPPTRLRLRVPLVVAERTAAGV